MSRRKRALRLLRETGAQMLVFGFFGLLTCAAIAAIGVAIAHVFQPQGRWETVLAFGLVGLSLAGLWFSMAYSGEIAWRLRGKPKASPRYFVRFTDEAITSSGEDKPDETVAWADLTEVAILNEDAFPVGWQYWLLAGKDGKGAVVPSEAEGMQELLRAMQERLPGFDNTAVIQAMGSLDGAFRVWRKPG